MCRQVIHVCSSVALSLTTPLGSGLIPRSEHGVSRVWTPFVIGARAEAGRVDPETFLDASAKLLGDGYSFTGPNPEIVRQAGGGAEGEGDSWPLSQALSILAEESASLEQILQLAAGFLALPYRESLFSTTKANGTVKILENIAREREDEAVDGRLGSAVKPPGPH